MIVLKFGGTSVGTPASIKRVIDIIKANDADQLAKGHRHIIVVFSAFGGATNMLLNLGRTAQKRGDWEPSYAELVPPLLPPCSASVPACRQYPPPAAPGQWWGVMHPDAVSIAPMEIGAGPVVVWASGT